MTSFTSLLHKTNVSSLRSSVCRSASLGLVDEKRDATAEMNEERNEREKNNGRCDSCLCYSFRSKRDEIDLVLDRTEYPR
jgi:hypothetical protein